MALDRECKSARERPPVLIWRLTCRAASVLEPGERLRGPQQKRRPEKTAFLNREPGISFRKRFSRLRLISLGPRNRFRRHPDLCRGRNAMKTTARKRRLGCTRFACGGSRQCGACALRKARLKRWRGLRPIQMRLWRTLHFPSVDRTVQSNVLSRMQRSMTQWFSHDDVIGQGDQALSELCWDPTTSWLRALRAGTRERQAWLDAGASACGFT